MEKEIGKIPKNDTTDIILRIDDFGGRTGLTIREFVTGDRYTGFTKSGVRISTENFPKFKEMIDSIDEEDMKQPETEPEESESEKAQPEPGQETLDEAIEEEKEKKAEKEDKEELPDY